MERRNKTLYFRAKFVNLLKSILTMAFLLEFSKNKRQIEILGLCIPDISERSKITSYDLCDLYEVGMATIERDLNELRSRGIPIHSQAREGIVISGSISGDILKNELLRYIGLCYANNLDELIDLDGCNKNQYTLLSKFVKLQHCIDCNKKVNIKNINTKYNSECSPRKILRKNKQWFLINQSLNGYEVISFNDFDVFSETELNFEIPKDDKIDAFVGNYFKIEQIEMCEITLSFASKSNIGFPSQISKLKILKEDTKGNKIVTAECKNIEELIPWIIANSGNILIIEPKELRDKILRIGEILVEEYKINEGMHFSREAVRPIKYISYYENPRILYEPKNDNYKDYFLNLSINLYINK